MMDLRRYSKYKGFIVVIFLILVSACGSNNNEPSVEDNGKDRKAILTHWADNIIIPSYERFKEKLDVMVAKSEAFTTSPSNASLSEFRAAWVDAYLEWQHVELFEFGPADKYTLRNFFNIYPTTISAIDANIVNPNANLDVPAAYATQGFPALDYLINGVGTSDDEVVAFYTDTPEGAKRLAYINRVTDRMNTLFNNVVSEWKSTYRDTFISKTGLDLGSSTASVANAYVLYYERYVRSGKIGIPSGATVAGGGVVSPEKVEAFYKKDISLALVKRANQAAQDFFNGKSTLTGQEGPSFKSYLNALDAKDGASGTLLSSIINDQFNVVNSKLNLLMPDLHQQVLDDNQKMADVFSAMQKLVRLLKVDMTSAMSVTITYTDNDGD